MAISDEHQIRIAEHLAKLEAALADGSDSAVDLAPLLSPDVLIELLNLVLDLDSGRKALSELEKASLRTVKSLAFKAQERRQTIGVVRRGVQGIRAALQPEPVKRNPAPQFSSVGSVRGGGSG